MRNFKKHPTEGKVSIDNRPDIESFLNTPSCRFVSYHLQNFIWTLKGLLGKNQDEADEHTQNHEFPPLAQDLLLASSSNVDLLDADRKKTICVIVPSRLKLHESTGEYLIKHAIDSISSQTCCGHISFTVIVGVDVDAVIPAFLSERGDVVIARSEGKSQIAALNAAIAQVTDHYDFVAFLEDDDLWQPSFITWALKALEHYDFVSATQLEVDGSGRIIGIFDFPTPSSWVMPTSTLRKVGAVDPKSKWHYDNEWLGRLSESGLRRCHLVERTAPTTIATAGFRPGLVGVIKFGGPRSELQRHSEDVPLVVRMSHGGSGTTFIRKDLAGARESAEERKWLSQRYGRLPH